MSAHRASPCGRYAVEILFLSNSISMFKSVKKNLSLVIVVFVSMTFVGFALAHEGDDHAHTIAQVDTSAEASVETRVRPLDVVRQRAAQIKQNAVDARIQLRVDTKTEMQSAETPEERRAILQGAAQGRMDIAQERRAETGTMVRRIRDVVQQHGGLIRQRFALALRHFESLSERIESRIEKMKAAGIVTASVEAELEIAQAAHAEAKADAQAIADFVAGVDDSADRAQIRTELQSLIRTAQASVKEAHQALQQVVRSLVALARENAPAVQSTTSVETETTVITE